MTTNFLSTLKEGKCLTLQNLKLLCSKIKEILIEESNILTTTSPIIICGDLHGQFYDLLNLFSKYGEPPSKKYIFLGDYVDRGTNSVETFELLLTYKLLYPDRIILLRGNHECRQISFIYGFNDEILRKYGNSAPFKMFTEVFDLLPISAIIDNKIFCVHGGLSPSITTVDQIRLVNRKCEIPHEGPFCDLVWSDPEDIETWLLSSRGAGWVFGSKVVSEFNRINGLELICRAHQLVNEGYKFWFKDKNLLTIWSCPNYCYRCGNKAAVLIINNNQQKIEVFESAKETNETQIKTLVPYFL